MAYLGDDRTSVGDTASRCLRRDAVWFGDVSYMVVAFNIFDSVQAAHVKGIQVMAIAGGQVPCLGALWQQRRDPGTVKCKMLQ